MSKAMDLEYPTFSLETVDRKNDERAQSRQVKKFNLNFDKKIKGLEENKEEGALFEAVSTGNVMKLEGLVQYLHQSMKKLSNTEYQSYGKNTLLKALLNLRDGRNNAITFLLDISKKMGDIKSFINVAYTDSYYKGQTALHIAIERRSAYSVQLLIKEGAEVHAEACGKFFQPHDLLSFYCSELTLPLAVCTNQSEVDDFLLENSYHWVDVRERDSLGNMVLHALVVVSTDNTPENTDFIASMWRLEDLDNNHGLTPIKLSAKFGKIRLFENMMHHEFHERETRHLLAGQLFTARLFFGLSDKTRVQVDFVCSYLQTIFLSSVLYCCGRVEYLGFFVLCLSLSRVTLCYFSRGYGHIGIYSVMIKKMILSDILRFLFVYVVFCFGFSAGISFLFCHFCMQGHRNTLKKVLPFSLTLKRIHFGNVSHNTMELFKFTIGMGDLESSQRGGVLLLISYIMPTYILLLNMLIAVMSRTVEKMSLESTSIWKLQRAITILDLERSLPCCLSRQLCSGVDKDLRTRAGEMDRRWCFRLVEEVNWNKWSTNLGIINVVLGSGDTAMGSPTHHTRGKKSWRGFLGTGSQSDNDGEQVCAMMVAIMWVVRTGG
uniref:Transient receptor potential cation channel, subfamily V, member 1 n=1 Tax=Oncorhynchus mykiss TaxID=8022 RepID=A0A8C7RWZ8_ONCMY